MKQNEIEKMLADTKVQLTRHQRWRSFWSNLRLLMFLVIVGGFAVYIKNHFMLGLGVGLLGLAAFAYFVHRFNVASRHIVLAENTLAVLERYDARTKGAWSTFSDDGSQYIEKNDYISTDLDLFGQGSLYQYISVAHTIGGRDALMRLLTRPNLRYIKERQASVKELLLDDALAIAFEALGFEPNPRREEEERAAEKNLRSYIKGKEQESLLMIKALAIGMPLVTAVVIAGVLMHLLPVMAFYICFFGQIGAAMFLGNAIQDEKMMIMAMQRRLTMVEDRINVLLKKDFKSSYLVEMQAHLKGANAGIRALNRLSNRWQLRENFIFFWPLAGFLAWDFNCMLMLARWRRQYGQPFIQWLDWIGEVEALYSLGTLSRVRSDEASMPEIIESDAPLLEMTDGKHPLLNPQTVVGNDYKQGAETVIITGSNMSGKSTFMRTVALNAVLAYAGGSVSAKAFRISPMRIFTSMRVRDDVGAGISTFYGEILRIKEMMAYSEKQAPMLVLVDEIFKGTNSADRIIGAEAAIRKITRPWMMSLVSTHDFELCALVENEEINGKNFHFEETYQGDTIHFDYKIKTGRCLTTNAQHLMRMAGLLDTVTKTL